MDKYYTPHITEFYVGFEYEHYDEKADSWLKCIYNTMNDQRGLSDLDESNMSKERVKYLFKEDIESIGFKLLTDIYKDSERLIFENEEGLILSYRFYKNMNAPLVHAFYDFGEYKDTIFALIVKNKSELKYLLSRNIEA